MLLWEIKADDIKELHKTMSKIDKKLNSMLKKTGQSEDMLFNWTYKNGVTYACIAYSVENRLFNFVIQREFKKAMHKLYPKAVINRISEKKYNPFAL